MKKLLLTPLMAFFFLAVAMKSNAQWNLTGNSNATATSVLGTTNAIPLNLTTNNVSRLVIDANGKIGIGTSTPINLLTVKGTGSTPAASWVAAGTPLFVGFGENAVGNADYILALASTSNNARPVFVGRRSRGTLAAPTAMVNNDFIMSMLASAHDGTAFQNPATIDFFVDGTPTAGNVPARISFVTGSNSSNRAERLKIGNTGDISMNTNQFFLQRSNGNVGIGNILPQAKLDITGQVKITGGSPAAGKVLTSDSAGLATWQAVPVVAETDPEVAVTDTSAVPRWNGAALVNGTMKDDGTNVGIGTASPTAKLDVTGNVKIADGTQGLGKVLTSDSTGLGSWQAIPVVPETDPKIGSLSVNKTPKWNGSTLIDGTITDNGNVGIGTINPGAKLDVAGNIKIVDGTQAIGKVLTSDNVGLASWKTFPVVPETDPKVGSLSVNNIPKWNGTTLADGIITDNGNVGIGTVDPQTKLHLTGNMLVSEPLVSINTQPKSFQNRTLINARTITVSKTDSSVRIFDPGGPTGNYDNNISAGAFLISNTDSRGFQVIIESIGLASGDSLFIRNDSTNSIVTFLSMGLANQVTKTFIINSPKAAVFFKSNADGSTGSGFSILFKRLFPQPGQPDVNGYAGQGLSYNASQGFFRVGTPPFNETSGNGSAAFGFQTTASGVTSFASGSNTTASGNSSFASGSGDLAKGNNAIALGESCRAVGYASFASGYHCFVADSFSTAMGFNNSAGGDYSTVIGRSSSTNGYSALALGSNCNAGDIYSIAMGSNIVSNHFGSIAIGNDINSFADYSTAMGNSVNAFHYGSFIIGDASSSSTMNSSTSNQMSMRFAGGYKLYSNPSHTTGVSLAAGGGAWSNVSDRRLKENFRTLNIEEVLQKLAAIPVTNWNYKSQPASQRHIGPMAQDFYAAFKLDGEGADTTINTMDINGVNMAAIQALEKRTAKLVAENIDLAKKNDELTTNNTQLKNKDADLQKQLDDLKAIVSKLVNDSSAMPCPPLAGK